MSFCICLLSESQIFIHKTCVSSSCCVREHNEELKYIWLSLHPFTDVKALHQKTVFPETEYYIPLYFFSQ